MDTASLEFFSPVLDGIDHWSEFATILPVLVLLELILSADNAVALASITKRLNSTELQQKALNIGITISLLLRTLLILTANIIIKYPFIQLIASIYLIYIVVYKFFIEELDNDTLNLNSKNNNFSSFLGVVALLALTDLAFSIDSVTAAVAISDQILLVLIGTFIGVLALRFTADLFIKWLDIFENLETAGYIAVALVGFKLLFEVILPSINIPEYIFFVVLLFVFIWGFYTKKLD